MGFGHTNKIVKLVFGDGDRYVSTASNPINPQEARRQSVQRCLQSLTHASRCRIAECDLPSCKKMKRVLYHARECHRKNIKGCALCKQLLMVCCYHARFCSVERCVVPNCFIIKKKIKERMMQHRTQQQLQLMRIQPDQRKCGGDVSAESNPINTQEARRQEVEQWSQFLTHASQCRVAECDLPSCKKMKRVLYHARECHRKNIKGCELCKLLIMGCCCHARICSVERCVVPNCFIIKKKIKERMMQHRPQQQLQLMRIQPDQRKC